MLIPKVKLVALIKNEAYFLPQWIYHHFYKGFDYIELYINRTTDNTYVILDKLKNYFPNKLGIHSSDWFDHIFLEGYKLPNFMQYGVYSLAYYNTVAPFDYIAFMDPDEFFMSINPNNTVHDCITDLNYPQQITLEWFNLDGREQYITPLFLAQSLKGSLYPRGKSIIKTGLELDYLWVHVQGVPNMEKSVLANGKPIKLDATKNKRIHESCMDSIKRYYIVHDWIRSPIFWLSDMIKGLAGSRDGQFIKGRKSIYNNNDNIYKKLDLRIELPYDYFLGYNKMIDELELAKDLQYAYQFHLHSALKLITLLKEGVRPEILSNIQKSCGSIDDIEKFIRKQIE